MKVCECIKLQHTGHTAQDTHPDMPTPLAGSHPRLEVRIISKKPSHSLLAGSPSPKGCPTLQHGSGADHLPPAVSHPCVHSARLRDRVHPAHPCWSCFFLRSSFLLSLVGLHQPCSSLAPGDNPSAFFPHKTLPTCC